MATDKLKVNDPRVEYHDAVLNGRNYHYILGKPQGTHRATVLLCHGFPDLGFAWRYQIPMLMEMGLQVVAPDMIGYGDTDAPQAPEEYTWKKSCADMCALLDQVAPGERVVVGGHDWGSSMPSRMPVWHPERVMGVFSLAVPYLPASPVWRSLEDLVATVLPNFRYQLVFAAYDLQRLLEEGGEPTTRAFLDNIHQPPAKERRPAPFSLDALRENKSLGPAADMDAEEREFYVGRFARRGWNGPFNWYRIRRANYDDEMELYGGDPASERNVQITIPALYVGMLSDVALPPAMAAHIEKTVPGVVRAEVDAGHWGMWTHAEEVNGHIKAFLEGILAGKPKASI